MPGRRSGAGRRRSPCVRSGHRGRCDDGLRSPETDISPTGHRLPLASNPPDRTPNVRLFAEEPRLTFGVAALRRGIMKTDDLGSGFVDLGQQEQVSEDRRPESAPGTGA